ncbi:MAG: helix-turn-helix transcriptional regulator [Betaproteobacteria bacterium]|nr:helix-turn-helix transcriptional regulator [Betaproteobacteria bacterium]
MATSKRPRATPANLNSRGPAAGPNRREPAVASNGLGGRLRLARMRSGLALRELARRIRVSPSLVSQIELGRVKPSVGTLYALSNELGLLLDDLFKHSEPRPKKTGSAGAPAGGPGPVQRKSGRKTIRLASGGRWERLTPMPDTQVEFLNVIYDVGASSCDEDSLIRHGGKEYAYMISGRLGVRIGFDEFELGPGDSISFDAGSPHRLWTIGRKPAVAVWVVVNRHGDRRSQQAK